MWPLRQFPDMNQFSNANSLQREESNSLKQERLWASTQMATQVLSGADPADRSILHRGRCIKEGDVVHGGQWGKLRDMASSLPHGHHG